MKGFEPEVFTRDEAAEFARVSVGKLDQWLGAGLKHIRTGAAPGKTGPSGILVLREHLLGWLRALADDPEKGRAVIADAPKRKPGRPRKAKGAGDAILN